MKKILGVLLLTVLVITLTGPISVRADGNILYAKAAAAGDGSCSSWDNACTLQTALSNAISGNEIWVQAGTYLPGSDRTDTFALKNGVALYGGFAGTESELDFALRNWETNQTILTGDITGQDVYHVVTGHGTDNTAILDGFIIQDGQADGFGNESGGGMYNNAGSPTVQNVIIRNNYATNDGGGMYNYSSSPNLINVTFDNNEANPASSTYGYGGGMQNNASSPSLENVRFVNNAANLGGGLSNVNESSPSLTGVTFEQNQASRGGGIFNNTASNPIINKTKFIENIADLKGGGVYNSDSSPTITNAIFDKNTASIGGGGIHIISSISTASASNVTLLNVTFFGNEVTATNGVDGGGIANESSLNRSSIVTIKNAILWGNIAFGAALDRVQIANTTTSGGLPSTTTITYSIIEDGGWPDTSNLTANPRFVDATNGNLNLQGNSPAIDSGTNTDCPLVDIDDTIRPQPAGGICDIGADEYFRHVSITRVGQTPTGASSLVFNVTFANNVSDVDVNDFVVSHISYNSSLSNTLISSVNGSGKNYTVTISTGSGNGALRLDIPATANITGLNSSALPYTSGETYFLARIQTFSDVPTSHWAWTWIERYYAAGLTTGCSWVPGGYCPGDLVTREQMAVFIMRAKNNGNYVPVPVTGPVFSDVPASHWAAGFIRDFANKGITTGCSWVPGGYCPGSLVTREQMAVFVIRAMYGGTYAPPPVISAVFTDVPASHWAAPFIKKFYDEGITTGCAWVPGGYCPGDPVTREQMAVFIGRAFDLP